MIIPAAVLRMKKNFHDVTLNLVTEFFTTEDSRRLGCEAVHSGINKRKFQNLMHPSLG
jgi:hypothetical protein